MEDEGIGDETTMDSGVCMVCYIGLVIAKNQISCDVGQLCRGVYQ